MNRKLLPLILIASLLAGCSLPTSNATPTPSNSDLETQVAQLLTSVPASQTAPAQPSAGNITVIPTQAQTQKSAPTVTSLPTVTPEATQAVSPTTAPIAAPTQAVTATPAQALATNTPLPTTASTPNATATQSSGTPLPTPTIPAGDPRAKLGTPTWQDNFTDNSNWPSSPGKFTSITVGGGKLQITGLTDLDGWRLTFPKIANFYMDTTFQTTTCTGADRYGMIVRVPDLSTANSGYLVGLTCDGKYSLRRWNGTHMAELIPWTSSDVIQAGSNQTNRLGLLAKGSQLTVYINGTPMKSATDSTFTEGYFGIWVGAQKTPNLTITATQMAYWENPNL